MEGTDNIIAREFKPDELEKGLELRNKIFPPITPEDWKKKGPGTASIAFDGDEVVGFIPLAFRTFKLAPGATITAAFENAVGTREDYRGRGVGTAMIEAASQFLKGRADALFVYRGGERSKAYNFYSKTGHIDLLYTRYFTGDNSIARSHDDVHISYGLNEILKHQKELFRVFEETYYAYGGFPLRHERYWERALTSPIYTIRPTDFYLFKLVERGQLTAYILAGIRRDLQNSKLQILEMGACGLDERRIKTLLESAGALSAGKDLEGISILTGDSNPFIDVLVNLNFKPGSRNLQTMSFSFDSKAIFEKVWNARMVLPGVEVKIFTPKQDFTLLEGYGENYRSVTLEMKEETLTRWVMGRLDFKARVREGTITVVNGNDRIVDAIANIIPIYDWEYHNIDFI